MPVDTPHKDYAKMVSKWKRCRDAACGQDAIHAGTTTYLPKLTGETTEEYRARVMSSPFYNATWRTIEELTGMLFRKEPVIECPDALLPLLDDISLDGTPFSVFLQCVTEDIIEVGRIGVLVDYPSASTEGMTAAQVSRLNLRPTMQEYDAENIINWRCETINNKHMLSMVVLEESEEVIDEKDQFKSSCEKRWRVLDLFNGVYRQRLYKKDNKGNDILISEYFPVMRGNNIPYIPFTFYGYDDLEAEPDEPVLLDMVNVNISHYITTSQYERGCGFTAAPQPVVTGHFLEAGQTLPVGSTSAWVIANDTAKAYYLEFHGDGLQTLERNLDRKERQMATLGARLLHQEKSGVESAKTATIRKTGEMSILAKIASTISQGMTEQLKVFADWYGVPSDNISVIINDDFIDISLSPTEAVNYMQMVQGGIMSHEAAFNNMKAGGMYSESDTFELEQERISSNPLLLTDLSGVNNGNNTAP